MNELTGKKIIIFGAGLVGKKALIYFGSRNVKCFADNNKAGGFYCGKNIISLDELCKIQNDYDIVLAVTRVTAFNVSKQLTDINIAHVFFRDILTPNDFESNPLLTQFKDKHKGEKCFIVGNGPSLKAEDLDVLYNNNIISFGCNRIYKIFDNTLWRPEYFAATDHRIMRVDYDTFTNLDLDHVFLVDIAKNAPESSLRPDSRVKNLYFFEVIANLDLNCMFFSDDPSKCVNGGFTVTYSMLQWAAYMGFKEIYLLGVDNSYQVSLRNASQNADVDHFSADYYGNGLSTLLKSDIRSPEFLYESMTRSYELAETYSRKHDFRIFNATRGGQLETFERVNFDSLF